MSGSLAGVTKASPLLKVEVVNAGLKERYPSDVATTEV